MFRKPMVAAVVLLVGLACLAGEELTLKGSTTVLPIAQLAAEVFAERFPEVAVSVQGGGSGVGIAALIDGTCDIADASRAMKPSEWARAVEKGVYPYHWFIASDGIAIVVHPQNPLQRLTLAEIKDLYTGRITNWKELGGPDLKVVTISRDSASGTYEVFKELVLSGEEPSAPGMLFQPSNAAVAEAVARTPGAIGYVGMGYLNPAIKALAVAEDEAGPYVLPSEEAVISGTYPIARPLFMITNGFPEGVVRRFIMFILSDEGQRLVSELGYVPIRSLAG
ncbi:MAG: Phosphate ABC transporter substrate-binding protein, PhoT family [Acetothermia bacterium 64_32]|nr:MAG: Phosphate ABC transporter substrate-binding protein, PhoT family [Acetothermia bacterium 64_32]HAF70865.1 phosphate ABC transporter substrate-binding protein [Candidatus Acetothermia bacterium]